MRTLPCCLAAALSLGLSGCADPHGGLSQADHDRAREALEKALAAWKAGEPAAKWSAREASVRFADDSWGKGHALIDYEVMTVRANPDGNPEALVRLKTRPKEGPPAEAQALYGIDLRKADQVSIGRDPMHGT